MAWFNIKKDKKKTEQFNEDIWMQCPKCSKHIFKEDWQNSHKVCPKCGYHGRITAWERIGITFDPDTFHELNASIRPADPLGFSDAKGSYKDKVKATQEKTGLNESIVTGYGKINGIDAVVGVMDFRFMGGSLSSGTGEKILRAANYAYDKKIPLIIFSASDIY